MTERQAWKKLARHYKERVDKKDPNTIGICGHSPTAPMRNKINGCLDGHTFLSQQLFNISLPLSFTDDWCITMNQLRSDFCWLMYFELGGE